MAKSDLGSIRRSQVLMTWGPGSIADFRTDQSQSAPVSALMGGLDEWDKHAPPAGLMNEQCIQEPRLQARLRVSGFRTPPVQVEQFGGPPKGGRLAATRFPRWLQCPQCARVKLEPDWNSPHTPGDPGRYCPGCSTKSEPRALIPVRFITACPRGHIDDFPWHWWVHRGARCDHSSLTLKNEGGAGLSGLVLRCAGCNRSRSLAGVFDKEALRGLECKGHRPWLGTPNENCQESPRVLQRGASNVWFPLVASALDIPPWSDSIQQNLSKYWDRLVAQEGAKRAMLIELLELDKKLGMPAERLADSIERRIQSLERVDATSLRQEEYKRFVEASPAPADEKTEFEVEPAKVPSEIRRWVSRVTRAKKLREVRALRGFTRIVPPLPGEEAEGQRIAPLSAKKLDWLPAIEVRGEGIFIELDHERLLQWEKHQTVRQRASTVHEAMVEMARRRFGPDFVPTRRVLPRTLLVHSLAHALMRQFSLTCGYPSASLRERLYESSDPDPMCGLLIYTATPDAEGTLGGLVRMGEPDRLGPLFEDALESMRWCSSDPLCIQGAHTRSEAQNGAACHACLLVAETSCEEFNLLLDRAMLVGTADEPDVGYFHELLAR